MLSELRSMGDREPGDGEEGDGAHRRENGDALPAPDSPSCAGNHRPEKLTSQLTSQRSEGAVKKPASY